MKRRCDGCVIYFHADECERDLKNIKKEACWQKKNIFFLLYRYFAIAIVNHQLK